MYKHIHAMIVNDKRCGHLKGRWQDLEVKERDERHVVTMLQSQK